MQKVYLDNAATTFPKPPCVVDAMVDFMTNIGSNPGRGGYEKALQSGRIVFDARQLINDFFRGPGEDNVIFTQNITMALNTVIKGMFRAGWHVITTSLEHNSVMRPLRRLEYDRDIKLSIAKCSSSGILDPYDIEKLITNDTKAVVMTHASNLLGTILPIEEIGRICKEHGLYFIVDTAQTAGTLDIEFKDSGIDVLAFTGHKGLFGPQGIGGFVISDRASAATSPFVEGGTGSSSHIEIQPDILPDKFESGTPNTVGIAGLKAGIEYIRKTGIDAIRSHEEKLTDFFIKGLNSIEGIEMYGPKDAAKQTSTLSLNVKDMDPGEVSYMLDTDYGIMTRSGMHCTPSGHKTAGTFPRGSVRFSIGYFNTQDEISYTLDCLKKISSI